jgi:hypothetical protein
MITVRHIQIKNLYNIDLKFLPPNTISLIQPFDQEIIKTYCPKVMQNCIVKTIYVCKIPASQTVLELI